MTYRVRALSGAGYIDSEWSESRSFFVCPMDINGDGDITGADRTTMVFSWLSGEGDDIYRYYADVNGDGDVSGPDISLLSVNWLKQADDNDLLYPRPLAAADAAFADYDPGDLDVDLDVF